MNPLAMSHARLRPALIGLIFSLPLAFVSAQEEPPKQEVVKIENDDIVKLDAFKVTSEIGTYHQSTSSMASKIPMDLKELASSLSIINATAITDRNAVTLTDVFNYVVGATQSQGNINGFSFRGFPNTGSYTQNIQFDGLMGATLKKAATSAANVESLEFLKGPNGVLYGQMNPGGLLNIVTKAPKEKQQTYIRATFGTFAGEFTGPFKKNTQTLSFDTTGPLGHSKHMFYRFIADAASSPSSRPKNWGQSLSLYPSFTYKWNPETYFTVKGEVSQDFRRQDDGVIPIFTNNTAFGSTAYYYTAPLNTVYNDSKDKATDRGSAISTYFHAALGREWTLRVQTRSVWHLDVVRELTVNNANVFSPASAFAKPTSLLRRQYNYVKNGHRYNFGDANIFRTFTTGPVTQTILVGIGGGKEFFGNARIAFGPNQTVAQAITLTHPTIDLYDYPADGTGATNQLTYQTAFGEYISDQIKIGERLHVSLGFRHDHQKVNGLNTLNPALTTFSNELKANTKQGGVVFDFTKNISGYASYSQSIKPQVNIAYDASGNSNFPPESGEQYEVGVKFDTPNKNVNVTLAAYEINRSNVIVASGTNFTVPTGSAQVGQAISRLDGGQQSRGFEFETQWQPLPNWQLQTGVAYSKAIITASIKNPTTVGLDLANAPRVSGNFWTRYNFPKGKLQGLGVGTGVIYVGKAWAGDPTTSVYYNLSGWTRVDSSIYYRWKNYDLALNVQNLLDRRYIGSAQSALTLNVGEQRKLTFSAGVRF
jgi:iron complex outermembrane receptor protein